MFNENLIRELAHQKSIDVDKVVSALEDALGTAARKFYKTREPIHATLLRDESGGVEMYVEKEVVETEEEIEDPHGQVTLEEARTTHPDAEVGGTIRFDHITKVVVDVVSDPNTEMRRYEAKKVDEKADVGDNVEIPLTKGLEELGRIAAQSAKQVLYQKVREAEREKVYREFKDRVGQIEHGYVKRFERGDLIVDLNGKTEAAIPRPHQSRAERYSQGDRIRAVVVDVHTQPKGPQVILSRTDTLLLMRLFEMEVPEIYDGTVVIKQAAREPGERSKIAVMSKERNVDPVGACVGMKGSRVQSIIRELRGEKIDIIPWHEDIVTFAQNALAPARITRVSVKADEEGERPLLDVIVDNDQLSLAIGKRGLNVRLASELIGARIEIKSEEEVKGEVADALTQMLQVAMQEARSEVLIKDVDTISPEHRALLETAGYDDLDSVLNASAADLSQIEGIELEVAAEIIDAADEYDRVSVAGEQVAEMEEIEDALYPEYEEEWYEGEEGLIESTAGPEGEAPEETGPEGEAPEESGEEETPVASEQDSSDSEEAEPEKATKVATEEAEPAESESAEPAEPESAGESEPEANDEASSDVQDEEAEPAAVSENTAKS